MSTDTAKQVDITEKELPLHCPLPGALQLGRRWQLRRALKHRGYRQAIVLPNSWKAALVPFFAGIPLRSGYVGESRYGLLNRLYRKPDKAMRRHYARLAEAPGDEPH